jgi:hypothetical protein
MDVEEKLETLIESPRFSAFSKWERDFLLSVHEEVDVGNFLTDKQKEKINDIYSKYFEK